MATVSAAAPGGSPEQSGVMDKGLKKGVLLKQA